MHLHFPIYLCNNGQIISIRAKVSVAIYKCPSIWLIHHTAFNILKVDILKWPGNYFAHLFSTSTIFRCVSISRTYLVSPKYFWYSIYHTRWYLWNLEELMISNQYLNFFLNFLIFENLFFIWKIFWKFLFKISRFSDASLPNFWACFSKTVEVP